MNLRELRQLLNDTLRMLCFINRVHLPVLKPLPAAPTLPSLYSFQDPAVFSHVAQMWYHFPSLADTEVPLWKKEKRLMPHLYSDNRA